MSAQGEQDQENGGGGPSQAEGDRATVEATLGEQNSGDSGATDSAGKTDYAGDQPSQAEGSRETVEQDLQEKTGSAE